MSLCVVDRSSISGREGGACVQALSSPSRVSLTRFLALNIGSEEADRAREEGDRVRGESERMADEEGSMLSLCNALSDCRALVWISVEPLGDDSVRGVREVRFDELGEEVTRVCLLPLLLEPDGDSVVTGPEVNSIEFVDGDDEVDAGVDGGATGVSFSWLENTNTKRTLARAQ